MACLPKADTIKRILPELKPRRARPLSVARTVQRNGIHKGGVEPGWTDGWMDEQLGLK